MGGPGCGARRGRVGCNWSPRLAEYAYNSQQQRVRKTVANTTTYFLWQQGKLVAEIDSRGTIQVQYLYFSEGQRATPIAKLEAQGQEGSETKKAERILFIHSDHRATPLAMTDGQQRIVWRAEITPWGMVKAGEKDKPTNQATLNIRLPGQYFEEETGLHDNWHRTYDPRTGRYLQPDPLGYPDGPDAYLYAQGDPINRTDPRGLYQEDVHYYMTYFLALVAGLPEKQARVIAMADRYIDSNQFTQPMTYPNAKALRYYHFTQDGYDPPPVPGDASYVDWRTHNPGNPQLDRLQDYAMQAPNPCAKSQFYGEFLHAFQDTFAHRDPA